ncbi:DUF5060 domain-containing protein [Paenibacillus sp. H1-7]|uniref:DUF5605 domain-containing protein n=1 Tax=Paenibacillus sp. H1-7 TaxID=2282849 RepID=UPI001EF9599F|nr:DUF5605 domain-containing protein [Paenibacillus sp. H1-7]ULL17180.1 DUF5060 domain-containing protein [Paenibacillus sp. H1-7]
MKELIQVECWNRFELSLPDELGDLTETSPVDQVKAVFCKGNRVIEAFPFHDNDGKARVRFMPDEEGEWSYSLQISRLNKEKENVYSGRLYCTAPGPGNHGPVRAADEEHFAYADGTPFYPFGTSCWYGYRREYADQTLETLAQSPFNKARFRIDAGSGIDELELLEEMIAKLLQRGIEAEILLDCSGSGGDSQALLHQAISRFSAFRNVWWSLTTADDGPNAEISSTAKQYLKFIRELDTYGHLSTICSSNPIADFGDSSITHVSLQYFDPSQLSRISALHRKPVIIDHCGSEGDWPSLEGSLPAEELVNRIWASVCRKGYAGHGEMYIRSGSEGEAWLTHGGALSGEAAARIAFLREILEEAPAGLRTMPELYDAAAIGRDGVYYLQYYGIHRFPSKRFRLPEGTYTADVIDVWNMTITPMPETFGAEFAVPLPSRLYHALRIRRTDMSDAGMEAIAANPDPNIDQLIQNAEADENFIQQIEHQQSRKGGTVR